jgi:fimbrial chaperone protein
MRWILATLFATTAAVSLAGEFTVSPIRAELPAARNSEAITVSNNGDSPLRVSLELKRWTQDASGNDIYTEAPDELVYFPRQFEIPPKKKQVVRVARRAPSDAKELAYRLYFIEQPSMPADGSQGGQLAMAVSFGVPVFIQPVKVKPILTVSPVQIDQGKLTFTLSNDGNVTHRLRRIAIGNQGASINQFDNWYLQPGASRSYQLALPKNACADSPQRIVIETDRSNNTQQLLIPPQVCSN